MKKSWNWMIWIGALVAVLGVVSYFLFFINFPALRDFPWVNLPMIALGLVLLGVGLARAFRQPQLYRGRVFGSVLGVLTFAFAGLFCWLIFFGAKMPPVGHGVPQVGQVAPDFTLPDSRNTPVNLASVLSSTFTPVSATGAAAGQTAGVVLIFYRGYW
jgi:hypothetical protein